MTSPFDRVISELEAHGCKPRGNHARCPYHGGKDPDSLTVTEGADRRVLLTCHSKECSYADIMHALGLTPADGFVRTTTVDDRRVGLKHPPGKITTTYDYTGADGELVFQVARYEPKTFRPRRPDGNGGWISNLDGIGQRPLYNLPAVLGSDLVLVVEGEKDADRLAEAGFTATTSAGGAGSAKRTDWSPTKRRRVVILPDNDKDGTKYRDDVGALLTEAGAAEVRVLELPGLADKGDVTDWLEAGHTTAELGKLIAGAPKWTAPGRPQMFTVAEICAAEYPEPRWAIPGLYPEGFALLCGKSKIGKSWQCLDLGLAVSMGGCALGKIQVEAGDVLYLALEDSPRRIKDRVKQLLGPEDSPPTRFHVMFEAPRLGDGLEKMIAGWLDAHPDARVVMIDTLARVRPKGARGKDWYLEDTEQLAPLQKLALNRRVMILAAGHLRKSASDDPLDLVSGSVGLTGVADTIAVLTRARGRADGELFITGRDIEERTLALTKQGVQWVLEGDAEEWRMSQARASIVKVLKDADEDGLHYHEIAEALDKPVSTTRSTLTRMVNAGQARRLGNGRYSRNTATTATCNKSMVTEVVAPVAPVTGVATDAHIAANVQANSLPVDLEHWPVELRHRVDEFETGGMKRAAAMTKARGEHEAKPKAKATKTEEAAPWD